MTATTLFALAKGVDKEDERPVEILQSDSASSEQFPIDRLENSVNGEESDTPVSTSTLSFSTRTRESTSSDDWNVFGASSNAPLLDLSETQVTLSKKLLQTGMDTPNPASLSEVGGILDVNAGVCGKLLSLIELDFLGAS